MYDALDDAVYNAAYLAAHLTAYHADGGCPCSGGTPTQTHGATVGGHGAPVGVWVAFYLLHSQCSAQFWNMQLRT